MKKILGLGSGRCGTESLSKFLDMQKDTSCTHEGKIENNPSGFFVPPLISEAIFYQNVTTHLCGLGAMNVGDVFFLHLKIADTFLQSNKDHYALALKREKSKTIKSFSQFEPSQSFLRGFLDKKTPLTNYMMSEMFSFELRRIIAECSSLDDYESHEDLQNSIFWSTSRLIISYFYLRDRFEKELKEKYPTIEDFTNRHLSQYYDNYYKKCEELEQKYPTRFKIFPTEDLNSLEGQKSILKFLDYKEEDMILVEGGIRKNVFLSL